MVNDPIGDMLTQIRNASLARKASMVLPHSRIKLAVAQILQSEGYIDEVTVAGADPKRQMNIKLKYTGKVSAVTGIKRISKPGLRWYVDKDHIPSVVGGSGIAILSTPLGVMTGREAAKRGVGGEVLCTVW